MASGNLGTSPDPPRLGSLRQGTQDTRYYDLSPDLAQLGDPIAAVTSVTVVRRDGTATGANDLTITPPGNARVQAPWIGETPGPKAGAPSPYPGINYAVFWWEGAGGSIAAGGAVDYLLTISVATVAGRVLEYDAYQLVTPALG